MCGGFPAQAICPLWRAKPARFCSQATWVSSSGSTHFWEAFGFCPTSARNAPHACLISSWAKAWSSGTPCLCPRAYKACMGRISCRCGTESKGFPKMGRTWGGNSCRLRTKPCGLGSPKRTNSLCGKSPTQIALMAKSSRFKKIYQKPDSLPYVLEFIPGRSGKL